MIKAESALHRFLNCGDLVRFRAHNGSHHRRLGEEAVSAYIEEESFVRHRSGEAAKNFVCLKDKWGIPLTSKLRGSAKAGRTAAENDGSRNRIGIHLA